MPSGKAVMFPDVKFLRWVPFQLHAMSTRKCLKVLKPLSHSRPAKIRIFEGWSQASLGYKVQPRLRKATPVYTETHHGALL